MSLTLIIWWRRKVEDTYLIVFKVIDQLTVEFGNWNVTELNSYVLPCGLYEMSIFKQVNDILTEKEALLNSLRGELTCYLYMLLCWPYDVRVHTLVGFGYSFCIDFLIFYFSLLWCDNQPRNQRSTHWIQDSDSGFLGVN